MAGLARLAGVLGIVGVLAVALPGCKRTVAPARPPEELMARLEQAFGLARAMVRYDLLAWWATDAVIAGGIDPATMRGWLVVPGREAVGEALILGPLTTGEVGVTATVRCDLAGGPESCVVDPSFEPRPLSAEERTMKRAIATAKSDRFFVHAQANYNTIVLRAADHGVDAGWIVYIVASTTDADEVPIGRHFRFDVSGDGARVLGRRASHRSVVTSRRAVPAELGGGQVLSFQTSAVFDAHPTEFQLYVSSLWRMPLGMVGCDGSLWAIVGLKVRQLAPGARDARCPDPWRESSPTPRR